MDWWQQWCAYHAAVFGWGATQSATYAAWKGIFAQREATAEELAEAVRRAAKSEKPLQWPADNLAALQAALTAIRRERAAKAVAGEMAPGEVASSEQIRRVFQEMRGIGRMEDN